MQVADIQGEATAATLGAQKTVAVTMVQDASFLMMLASNLYSNQKLAVVREVMCNAWDAQIESGMTHVPVKVTITEENELIIEDSGYGIPAEMFPEVYGTMGGSTKRKNVAVTGGFGLGAKSPWSYVDSFRVINENQGTKTIYNLVKASVEAEGHPAIQQVMQVPTERSGLTVRFQLQDEDVRTFIHYIRYIAMHGDMLVDLHTSDALGTLPVERLPTMNLDKTPGSYDINHEAWYAHYMGNHSLFVRYGAVIYPMLQTPGTEKAIGLLKQFMEIVGFKKMVVQVAPGTLALTPNREALSSSKMTEDGITDMCVALVQRIEDDIIKQIPASIKEAVQRLEKGHLHSGLQYYPNSAEAITPMPVRKYLQSTLGTAKRVKYEAELSAAEHRGFKATHTFTNKAATHEYHRLRRRLGNKDWQTKNALKYAFLKHYVLRPLAQVFQKHATLLKVKSLHHAQDFYHHSSNRTDSLLGNLDVTYFADLMQLIDNPTVFVTARTKRLKDSIECCPFVTIGKASWVYKLANAKDGAKDDIINAFRNAGMQVVDLTLNHDWDDAAADLEAERLRRNANRKPTKTAGLFSGTATRSPNLLMSLCNVFNEHGLRSKSHSNIKLITEAEHTTDTPLFYVEVDHIGSEGRLGRFGHYLDLTDDEGKLGVVVRTGTEKNMAIKRGAVDMDTYFAQKAWDRANSKAYLEYRTKFRKLGVAEDHRVSVDYLDLCAYLGIKLPGFDKLITDPAMERVVHQVADISASSFGAHLPHLSMDELKHYGDVVRPAKLIELPIIPKLKALRKDDLLNLLFYRSDFLETVKKYPERKAGLKSLVQSALKNGNQDE
jgi:hypothetical protein